MDTLRRSLCLYLSLSELLFVLLHFLCELSYFLCSLFQLELLDLNPVEGVCVCVCVCVCVYQEILFYEQNYG